MIKKKQIAQFPLFVSWLNMQLVAQKDVTTVKDRFICHKFGFEDLVMELACGLHNFKISLNISAI